MKKYTLLFAAILILSGNSLLSQNLDYTKEVLDKLCSPELFGRGYVKKGDSISADYIASEFDNSDHRDDWKEPDRGYEESQAV